MTLIVVIGELKWKVRGFVIIIHGDQIVTQTLDLLNVNSDETGNDLRTGPRVMEDSVR